MSTQSELVIKIQKQQDLAEKIRDLQKQEKELRASILEECFGTDNVGTKKTQVENVMVTGTYGLTYKMDQSNIEEALMTDTISDEAAEAVRTKYELDKKKYDALDEDVAAELDDYMTITPSLPSIKIKYIEEDEE